MSLEASTRLTVVILGAGHGSRLRSSLPKPLTPIGPKSCLDHLICTARTLNPEGIVVVHSAEQESLYRSVLDADIILAEQPKIDGTASALQAGLASIDHEGQVLVLLGDTPLVQADDLVQLIEVTSPRSLGLITCHVMDPTDYGRIIRQPNGSISSIVEQKHLSPEQGSIREINSGIFCLPLAWTRTALEDCKPNPITGERYFTDLIAMAYHSGYSIMSHAVAPETVQGINTPRDRCAVERTYQKQIAELLIANGVTIIDPNRFDVRGTATIGSGTVIDINVILEGTVQIGKHCTIGPNCVLKDVILDDHVTIGANSVCQDATFAQNAKIGPFAYCRVGTHLAAHAKVGSFVETKQLTCGPGSKIPHLSYIGDCTIGTSCNIGAGVITCNYDGHKKHQTHIGDHVFVGAATQLIAPVRIGSYATLGAGSCIRKAVAPYQLALSRVKQRHVDHWHRPRPDTD